MLARVPKLYSRSQRKVFLDPSASAKVIGQIELVAFGEVSLSKTERVLP